MDRISLWLWHSRNDGSSKYNNSFIDKRFSNGFTEGLNNKIKVIKRVGFGYKNFDFFRLRIPYIMNVKVSGITKKDRNAKISKK